MLTSNIEHPKILPSFFVPHKVAKRHVITEHEDEDVANGTYLAADSIVEKEGGFRNPKSIKAAWHYIQECYTHRGKWIKYFPWQQRYKYLYVELSHRQTFREKKGITKDPINQVIVVINILLTGVRFCIYSPSHHTS